MKPLVTTAIALCMLVLIGCAEGSAPEPEAAITEAASKVQANVSGMDCSGCSSSIAAAVEGIEGVTACQADAKTGDVQVALDDSADAEATKAEIEAVIAGLSGGKFTVNTIAVSTTAQDHTHADGECCGSCSADKKETSCCGSCGGDKKEKTSCCGSCSTSKKPAADTACCGSCS